MQNPVHRYAIILVAIFAALFSFLINSQDAYAQGATEVGGLITNATSWLQSDSPYVITTTVVITQQGSLFIEPGVVIKSQGDGIVLQGFTTLFASGTITEPIVFTSIKDDAFGGDTNNDGATTLPVPGDWEGLVDQSDNAMQTGGSTLQLDQVQIRYAVIGLEAQTDLFVTNTAIEESSTYGLLFSGGSNLGRGAFIRDSFFAGGSNSFADIVVDDLVGPLTIQRTRIRSQSGTAVELQSAFGLRFENNVITQTSTLDAILIDGADDSMLIADNIIIREDDGSGVVPTSVGIAVLTGTPYIIGTEITNFLAPIRLEGFPETSIIEDGNTFDNNRYIGIAISGPITSGSWDPSSSIPYFIGTEDVRLEDESTLTIPLNTVIKSAGGKLILGQGATLNAALNTGESGPAEPAIFTSIKDDAVGGDLNNDGAATTPAPGDWGGIEALGSSVSTFNLPNLQLDNVEIRYADVGVRSDGNLSLTNSILQFNHSHNLLSTVPAGRSTQLLVETNRLETTNATNISIRGQPAQLAINNNLLRCAGTHCLYLRDIEFGELSNNQLNHSGGQNAALFFQDVGEQFVVTENDIQHFGGASQVGFAVASSAPQLISNTVQGFDVAVWVDGFPQFSPIYTSNLFDGNRYAGVALGNQLTDGLWQNVGGYDHFIWEQDLIVEAGATLTITAGQIISSTGGGIIVEADATLNAVGTAEQPILFTRATDPPFLPQPASVVENNVVENNVVENNVVENNVVENNVVANNVAASNVATALPAGDWTGLVGHGSQDPRVPNSTLNLQFVEISFASTGVAASGNLTFTDSLVEGSYSYDLALDAAAITPPVMHIARSRLRNEGLGFATNLSVNGQPKTLVLQENVIESTRAFALQLNNVLRADISDNEISQNGSLNPAVYLQNVGDQVILNGNQITRSQGQAAVGILSVDSQSPLTGNTISGFENAIEVDGFPQNSPTYAGNTLAGNRYNGVALSGNLTSGSWIPTPDHPHFIGGTDLLLPAGISLTIPAGQVVKSVSGALTMGNGATLNAIGTEADPIIFTSIKDDLYGGDTNNDGSQSLPDPGDWGGISSLDPTGMAAMNLGHVLVRYAETGLETGGNLALTDGVIEASNLQAIQLSPPVTATTAVSLERSILRGSSLDGLAITQLPTTLNLKNNAIYNNNRFGLRNSSPEASIDATGIWWGDAVGPKADPSDAKGAGDVVSGNVNYAEWLTAPPSYVTNAPAVQPPVTPITTTPPVGVEPPPPIILPPSVPTTADSFEGNNDCAQATPLAADGSLQEHTFHAAGDEDWVRFNAEEGQRYRIEVQARANSTADVNMEVYAVCGGAIEDQFDETFTAGVRLDLEAAAAGSYYLKLSNSDATVFGDDAIYAINVAPQVVAQSQEALGAVILMEGRLKIPDRLQPNIANVLREAYDLFKSSGYDDDSIYYMSVDPTGKGVDAPATAANLEDAITNWAVSRIGVGQPLTIYIMDHGNIDRIYIDEPFAERISPLDVHGWLNTLEQAKPEAKVTVVIEACHSGSFIEGTESLSKMGRIIISSTNVENVAFASATGAQFSDRFLDSLSEGFSLVGSFWDARNAVQQLYSLQEPWIDANGNGIPNEQADLDQSTSGHNPGTGNQPADFWAPYIVSAEGPESIVDGRGTIRAEVRDNKGIRRVWGVIYPPSYSAPETVEELVPEDVPSLDFVLHGNDIYSSEYTDFTESGVYRVALFAEDTDGLKSRLRVLEINTGTTPEMRSYFLPLVQR